MVQKPTMPSAVGTIDGSSRLRWCSRESAPSTLADMAGRPPIAITIASNVETSTISPRPPRAACRAAAAADRRGERARQPLTEPAAGLHGFVVRPAAAGDRAAQRLQDEFVGDDLVVDVGTRRSERRHGHHHRRRAGVRGDVVERPAVGQVGEHDVGAGQ